MQGCNCNCLFNHIWPLCILVTSLEARGKRKSSNGTSFVCERKQSSNATLFLGTHRLPHTTNHIGQTYLTFFPFHGPLSKQSLRKHGLVGSDTGPWGYPLMELSGNNGVVHNDLVEGSSGSLSPNQRLTWWEGLAACGCVDLHTYACTKVSSCKKAKKHISAAELNHHFIHKMNQLYKYEASQQDIWDWIQDVMA